MGTNYYLHPKAPCKECGRPFESLHIGKSSAGWCFSLRVYQEKGIHTLYNWIELFLEQDSSIEDEYGRGVTIATMLETIMKRSWVDKGEGPALGGIEGPNNLTRAVADGRTCLAHGQGTWDYIEGDFS